ncbi:M23 family metallopeptidase [Arcticibacterium luteifluviistationis]|uniref:M23ase beta-sheet core domain-containing protein n=1 Tax=Arcticibacterium luteifluviistationis TaxID=1784714 RepID=A0A2Z4GB36_9BACT|nr:M23 family metallopeptidase [Arcticibacterium luteifluviistationis]AWV98436.1 hypothetical protein DJ013_09715 [Arcticibacterium luteifluviistationis]
MIFNGFSIVYYFFLLFSFPSPETEVVVEKVDPYVKGYFMFPLSPGVQTSLSGSFGDLRVNHFHAGLDIRTGGAEGKSIYAAAEGYVSRIRVMNGGYGNALYITHPNGLTTVYGHLKEYASNIKKRVVAEQYAQETFVLDIYFEPTDLPVKKGELVAFSGNTGGSGGPHLHFEIRDQEENTLDPALFGFKEIKDNVAPRVEFVSLKCLSADARINGEFGTFDYPVTRTSSGQYVINRNIDVWGDIGVELYAYDKAETSPFRLGLKYIEVKNDNVSEYKFELGKLAFHNKIDMNLHTNYERMVEQNKKLHKGYFEEGNEMDFYTYNAKKGLIDLRDSKKHRIEIKLKDTFENTSFVHFSLNSNANQDKSINSELRGGETRKVDIRGPFMKIIRKKTDKSFYLVDGNFSKEIQPSYENATEQVFVINLKESYFSSFMDGQEIVPSPVSEEVSQRFNTVFSNSFEIDFKKVLYHPIYLNLEDANYELRLDKDVHPLRGRFDVKWKRPDKEEEKNKVYLIGGRRSRYVGGNWDNGIITFHPKELGTYGILKDETAPSITPRTLNASNLSFTIRDGLSGIKSFECHVDGKWVLLEYEYKNGLLWSEKLNNEPFKGEVVLKVTDNCDNEKIYKTAI